MANAEEEGRTVHELPLQSAVTMQDSSHGVITLQREIQLLPGHRQERLAAPLTELRMRRNGEDQEIQRRLDDPNPENWRSWEQVKADLGIRSRLG